MARCHRVSARRSLGVSDLNWRRWGRVGIRQCGHRLNLPLRFETQGRRSPLETPNGCPTTVPSDERPCRTLGKTSLQVKSLGPNDRLSRHPDGVGRRFQTHSRPTSTLPTPESVETLTEQKSEVKTVSNVSRRVPQVSEDPSVGTGTGFLRIRSGTSFVVF